MMPGAGMMAGPGPMPYMAGGAAAKPQQDITQSKSTTIYVGKIAATLDDDVMMKLLEACGKVKQWKPVKDPSNNQPKGFGFVEYEVSWAQWLVQLTARKEVFMISALLDLTCRFTS
jgi:RNA-binding protein 25